MSRLFYATRAKLPANPRPGKIGQNEWTNVFLAVGYSASEWPTLGGVFAGWVKKHDDTLFRGLLNLAPENTTAASLGVQCTDAAWPKLPVMLAATRKAARTAPFVSWLNMWQSAPCAFWPARAQRPVPITGAQAPPVLLVDQTLDAPTPYSGSLATRRLFQKSRLVAVPGGTDHASSVDENTCLARYVANYLTRGTLPARATGNRADAARPAPQIAGLNPVERSG